MLRLINVAVIKHPKWALITNYDFDEYTTIIVIKSIILSFY